MLSWLQGSRDVYALIARGSYSKAAQILERQLRKEPHSNHLRQLLADVYERMGRPGRAVKVLETLVDDLAAEGFAAKSIAVLKKIQRIDPDKSNIDIKLATIIEQQDESAGDRIPLIQAHLAETDTVESPAPAPLPAADAASPEAVPGIASGEFATSVIKSDWFEDVVAQRQDFHWSPVLASCSKSELAALIGGLKLLVKKPGAIIYGEDAPAESMFILASGRARVYRRNGIGHYEQVSVLREGEYFGEASVLTRSNRLSTITAASECELLELDKETFDRICERFPRIRKMVQQLYDERVSFETSGLE